jgi:hypothetical protein
MIVAIFLSPAAFKRKYGRSHVQVLIDAFGEAMELEHVADRQRWKDGKSRQHTRWLKLRLSIELIDAVMALIDASDKKIEPLVRGRRKKAAYGDPRFIQEIERVQAEDGIRGRDAISEKLVELGFRYSTPKIVRRAMEHASGKPKKLTPQQLKVRAQYDQWIADLKAGILGPEGKALARLLPTLDSLMPPRP